MPYKANWMKHENGVMALVIPRVLFCGIVNKDERPDFRLPGNMDAAWWQQAIETARLRKGKGKREAYLLKRHNGFIEADHIGYLDNITFENPHAYCDVVVTNPEEIKAVLRGERANMSAETDYERHFVWGLSLIQGQEGHFSEEIPELRVEGVSLEDPQAKALGAGASSALAKREPELVALAAAVNDPRRVNMLFSSEQQTELKKLIDAGVTGALAGEDFKKALNDGIKAALTAHKPEPKEPKAGEDAEVAKLTAELAKTRKEKSDVECQLALEKRKAEIDEKANEIKKAGNPLSLKAIKAQLAATETDEGFKERFEKLKAAKLSTDDPAGEPDPAQGDGKKGKLSREEAGAKYNAALKKHMDLGKSRMEAAELVAKEDPKLKEEFIAAFN